MICQLIKKNVVASFILATTFLQSFYAQEAEKLFHTQYSKISFVYQPSKLLAGIAGNNDNSTYPSMNLVNSKSTQFGFYYNFAQKGRFNFKTGIIAKEVWPLFDLNINDADVGLGSHYDLTNNEISNLFIVSIPIKAECFIPIAKKFNLTLSAGLNLDIATGGNETLITKISVFNETQEKTIFRASSTSEQRGFSGEISGGINYKSKFALIQLDFIFSQNLFTNLITGDYIIENLENSSNTNGSFTINNNFYSLSLSVTPKKGWLKRKSK